MRAYLQVNLKALKENIKILSRFFADQDSFFCPIVKANAYGHGALQVATSAKSEGVRNLGVISLEEALELKSLSQEMNIYILGPLDKGQMDIIGEGNFIPVVGRWEDLENLSKLSKKEIPFHIKFNLGMNRLGFSLSETEALIRYVQGTPYLKLKGVSSHLSEGERAGMGKNGKPNSTAQEINRFENLCKKFEQSFPNNGLKFHLLNSAGGWAVWSHSRWNNYMGFRPGLCLYGIKPKVIFYSEESKKKYHSVQLKPVSMLKAFIIESRVLSPGQSVSYGRTWMAKKKTALAVVSIGYADGFPYPLSNKAEVLFRGEKAPVVGRVCMDFFMIDVTKILKKAVKIQNGEEVVIFGSQKNNFISLEEQAEKAGSIPYQILTGLRSRVRRVYV